MQAQQGMQGIVGRDKENIYLSPSIMPICLAPKSKQLGTSQFLNLTAGKSVMQEYPFTSLIQHHMRIPFVHIFSDTP